MSKLCERKGSGLLIFASWGGCHNVDVDARVEMSQTPWVDERGLYRRSRTKLYENHDIKPRGTCRRERQGSESRGRAGGHSGGKKSIVREAGVVLWDCGEGIKKMETENSLLKVEATQVLFPRTGVVMLIIAGGEKKPVKVGHQQRGKIQILPRLNPFQKLRSLANGIQGVGGDRGRPVGSRGGPVKTHESRMVIEL
ncbi:hypothetical protein BDZ94DRAFT_1232113 [Collybia nuda]|uniref:Uncharacterized protein n=1 Tax=Collybia nuda TaxID=64659 RepID=A0A9P5YIL9_9AGAR|nr:hypothetical protein BDZ94DRAFT_1232113 [Collybia nuda]